MNHQWVNKEIKEEIKKKYLEKLEDENAGLKSLGYSANSFRREIYSDTNLSL